MDNRFSGSENWSRAQWDRQLFHDLSYDQLTARKIREEPANVTRGRIGDSQESLAESDFSVDERSEHVSRDKILEQYLEEKGLMFRDASGAAHFSDAHRLFKLISQERYAGGTISSQRNILTLPERKKFEQEREELRKKFSGSDPQLAEELAKLDIEEEARKRFSEWSSRFESDVVNPFLEQHFFDSGGRANDTLLGIVSRYKDNRSLSRPASFLSGGLRYDRHGEVYLGVIGAAKESLDVGMFTNEHFTVLQAIQEKVTSLAGTEGSRVRIRTNTPFNIINRISEAVLKRLGQDVAEKRSDNFYTFTTSASVTPRQAGDRVTDHFKMMGANLTDDSSLKTKVLAIGSANVTQAALGKMVNRLGGRVGDVGTNVESTFVLSFDLVERGLMDISTFKALTKQAEMLMDWANSNDVDENLFFDREKLNQYSELGIESRLLGSKGLRQKHKSLFGMAKNAGARARLQIVTYNIGTEALNEIVNAVKMGAQVDILIGARYDFTTGSAADMKSNELAIQKIRQAMSALNAQEQSRINLIEDAQRLVHAKSTMLQIDKGNDSNGNRILEYHAIYGSMNLDDEQYGGRYNNEDLKGDIRNAGVYLSSKNYTGLSSEWALTSQMMTTSKYYSRTPAGISLPAGWEVGTNNVTLKQWYDSAKFDGVSWSEVMKDYGMSRSAVRPTQMGAKIRVGGKIDLGKGGGIVDLDAIFEFTVTQTSRGSFNSLYIPELTKLINSVYGIKVAESLTELSDPTETPDAKLYSPLQVIGSAYAFLQGSLEQKIKHMILLDGVQQTKLNLRDPVEVGKLRAEMRKMAREAFENFAGIEPGESAYGSKEYARLAFLVDKDKRLSFDRKFSLDARAIDAFYRHEIIERSGGVQSIANLHGLEDFMFMAGGLSRNKGNSTHSAARLYAMSLLKTLPSAAVFTRKAFKGENQDKDRKEYFLMLPATKLEQMSQRLQTQLAARNLIPTADKYKNRQFGNYDSKLFGRSRFVSEEAQLENGDIDPEKVKVGMRLMGFMVPFMAGDNAYLIAEHFRGQFFSDTSKVFNIRVGNSPDFAVDLAEIMQKISDGGANLVDNLRAFYPSLGQGPDALDPSKDFMYFESKGPAGEVRKKVYLSSRALKEMDYKLPVASFFIGDSPSKEKQFISLAGSSDVEALDQQAGLILDVTEGTGLSITQGPGYRTLSIQAETVRTLTSGDRSVIVGKQPYLFITGDSKLVTVLKENLESINPFSRLGGSFSEMNALFSSGNIKVGDAFIQTGIEVITNDKDGFLEKKIRSLIGDSSAEGNQRTKDYVKLFEKLIPFMEGTTSQLQSEEIDSVRRLLVGISRNELISAAERTQAADSLINLLSKTKQLLNQPGKGISIARNPAEVSMAFLAFGMHVEESIAELQKDGKLEKIMRELGYDNILKGEGKLTIQDIPDQIISRIIPMVYYTSPSASAVAMSGRERVNFLNYHAGGYTDAFYDLLALDPRLKRKQAAFRELMINSLAMDRAMKTGGSAQSFWGNEIFVGGLDFSIFSRYQPGFKQEMTRVLEILRELQGHGIDVSGRHKKYILRKERVRELEQELKDLVRIMDDKTSSGKVLSESIGSVESQHIQEILSIQEKAGIGARTVRIAKIGVVGSDGRFSFDHLAGMSGSGDPTPVDVRVIDVNFLSASSLKALGSFGDYSHELQRLQVEIEKRLYVLEGIHVSSKLGKAYNLMNEEQAGSYRELLDMVGQYQGIQQQIVATELQKVLAGQYSISGKNMIAGTAPDVPFGTAVLGGEAFDFLMGKAKEEIMMALSKKLEGSLIQQEPKLNPAVTAKLTRRELRILKISSEAVKNEAKANIDKRVKFLKSELADISKKLSIGAMTSAEVQDAIYSLNLSIHFGEEAQYLLEEEYKSLPSAARKTNIEKSRLDAKEKITKKVGSYFNRKNILPSEGLIEDLTLEVENEIEKLERLKEKIDKKSGTVSGTYGVITGTREIVAEGNLKFTVLEKSENHIFTDNMSRLLERIEEKLRGGGEYIIQSEAYLRVQEVAEEFKKRDEALREGQLLTTEEIIERSTLLNRKGLQRKYIQEGLGLRSGTSAVPTVVGGNPDNLPADHFVLGADAPTLSLSQLLKELSYAEAHRRYLAQQHRESKTLRDSLDKDIGKLNNRLNEYRSRASTAFLGDMDQFESRSDLINLRTQRHELFDARRDTRQITEQINKRFRETFGGRYEAFAEIDEIWRSYRNARKTGFRGDARFIAAENQLINLFTARTGLDRKLVARDFRITVTNLATSKGVTATSLYFQFKQRLARTYYDSIVDNEDKQYIDLLVKNQFDKDNLIRQTSTGQAYEEAKAIHQRLGQEINTLNEEVSLLQKELKSATLIYKMKIQEQAEASIDKLLENFEIRSVLMRGLFQRAGAPMGPVAMLVTKILSVNEYNERHGHLLKLDEHFNRRSLIMNIGSMMFNLGDFDGDTASSAILSQYTKLNAIRLIAGMDAIKSLTERSILSEVDRSLNITTQEQAIRMARYLTGWDIFADSFLFGTSDTVEADRIRERYTGLSENLRRLKEIRLLDMTGEQKAANRIQLERQHDLARISDLSIINTELLSVAPVSESLSENFNFLSDQIRKDIAELETFHLRKRQLFSMATAANQFAADQQTLGRHVEAYVAKQITNRNEKDSKAPKPRYSELVSNFFRSDEFRTLLDKETMKSMRSVIEAAGGGELSGKFEDLSLLTENQMKTFFVMTSWASTVLIGKTFEIAFALQSSANKQKSTSLFQLGETAKSTFFFRGAPEQPTKSQVLDEFSVMEGVIPVSELPKGFMRSANYKALNSLSAADSLKHLENYIKILEHMGATSFSSQSDLPETLTGLPDQLKDTYELMRKSLALYNEYAPASSEAIHPNLLSNPAQRAAYIKKAKELVATQKLIVEQHSRAAGTILIMQQIARDAIKPKSGDFWKTLRQRLYGESYQDQVSADKLVKFMDVVESGISLAKSNVRVKGLDAIHQIMHGEGIEGEQVGAYETWEGHADKDGSNNYLYESNKGIPRIKVGQAARNKRERIFSDITAMYEDYFQDTLLRVAHAARVSGASEEFVIKELTKKALSELSSGQISYKQYEALVEEAKTAYYDNKSGDLEPTKRIIAEEADIIAKKRGKAEVATALDFENAVFNLYARKQAQERAQITIMTAAAEGGEQARRSAYMRALHRVAEDYSANPHGITELDIAKSAIEPSQRLQFFGEAVSRGKITDDVVMRLGIKDLLTSFTSAEQINREAEKLGIREFGGQLAKLYDDYQRLGQNYDRAMRRLVWAEGMDDVDAKKHYMKELKEETLRFTNNYGDFTIDDKMQLKGNVDVRKEKVIEIGTRAFEGKVKQKHESTGRLLDQYATNEEKAIKNKKERREKILNRLEASESSSQESKEKLEAYKQKEAQVAAEVEALERSRASEIIKLGKQHAHSVVESQKKRLIAAKQGFEESKRVIGHLRETMGGGTEAGFTNKTFNGSVSSKQANDVASIAESVAGDAAINRSPHKGTLLTGIGAMVTMGAASLIAATPADAAEEGPSKFEKVSEAIGAGVYGFLAFASPSAALTNAKAFVKDPEEAIFRTLEVGTSFGIGALAMAKTQTASLRFLAEASGGTLQGKKFTYLGATTMSGIAGLFVGSAVSLVMQAMAFKTGILNAYNSALQFFEVGRDIVEAMGFTEDEMDEAFSEQAGYEVRETITLYHPNGEPFTFEGYVYNTQSIDDISGEYDSPLEGGLDTYVSSESFEMQQTAALDYL